VSAAPSFEPSFEVKAVCAKRYHDAYRLRRLSPIAIRAMKRSIRAALLDIDGTFVASNDAHASAWSDAARETGFDLAPDFFRPMIGMGGDRILPKISPELRSDGGIGKRMTDRRKAIFLERYAPGLRATKGARDLVSMLADAGIARVTASAASTEELDVLLEIAGIADLITATTGPDDADSSKPSPDIVVAALERAGVDAGSAVFVGDTPYDIEAGRNAGIATIAFRSGGWNDEALSGAAAIYDGPADLAAHFADAFTTVRQW